MIEWISNLIGESAAPEVVGAAGAVLCVFVVVQGFSFLWDALSFVFRKWGN